MKNRHFLISPSNGTKRCAFLLYFLLGSFFFAAAQTWDTVGTADFSDSLVGLPSITVDSGGAPYLVYSDYSNGRKATAMKFTGGSWTPVGIAGFTSRYVGYPTILLNSRGIPYVAYKDTVSGPVSVMAYNGSSWEYVGSPDFAAGQVSTPKIAMSSNDTPYVGYVDNFYNGVTVKKYDGTNWVTVGTPAFSASWAQFSSFAVDSRGTPYIAYGDGAYSLKATVMKYAAGTWVTVGSAGFSGGEADYNSLAIDTGGTPFVAFEDFANGNRVTVMKFDGTSWVTVGVAGFSLGEAFYISLAIDKCGTPYVSYLDNSLGQVTAMKFFGGRWVSAGTVGFSPGSTGFTSIAISPNSVPYVAYDDNVHGGKATVMDLNAAPISPVSGLCVGDTVTLSDTMSGGAWSSSNTGIATIGSGGLATAMSAGTDTVMFTMGCQSATLSLTVNPLPSAGEISGAGDLCAGSASAYTDTAAGGVWSTGTASIAGIGSTGVMNGLAAGAAVLTYTVNNGICSAMVYDTVTVDPLPNAGVITGVDTICPGDTMRLADTVTGGAWSIANASIASISGAGTVRGFAEGRDTAMYVVTNSCGSDTGVFSFFVRSPSACPNSVNTLISVAASMVVYPNPCAGLFTLRLNAEMNTPAQITVTNMLGEIVKSMTLPTNQNNDLNLPMPPGVYFISAAMGSEQVNGKVVVE